MRNPNVIGIYSTVITDPSVQYTFTKQFDTEERVETGPDSRGAPRDPRNVEPLKMTKLVLHCAHRHETSLKRAYPMLYPYMDVHHVGRLGCDASEVRANVCVHLDPLIGEVLGLQVKIATQRAEHEVACVRDELRKTETALSTYHDLSEAYSKRVDNFNNLSLFTKLVHVVIAWFNDHKAV
ncbi:hypothetical protein [Vibrio phage vB_VhaS-tm]|nr:hypothetical protein [Vibrio phage vB_VhaS-tm]